MGDPLDEAWRAYRAHDWSTAYEHLISQPVLDAAGVVALADCAWWLGRNQEALGRMEEAYRMRLADGEPTMAARLAMDLGFLHYLRGETAVGSGWIGRARRLVQDAPACVEHGYLLAMAIDEAAGSGDVETAIDTAQRVREIADLYRDPTLFAIALAGEGVARAKAGDVAGGLAALDEAMVLVRGGEVDPAVAGNIYCRLISLCSELGDLARAREWTEATRRWCEGFPSAVMFAGVCRVHQAHLLRLRGHWAEAEEQARQVCRELADLNVEAVAEAHYQIGEVRRLCGDRAGAEAAFARAHELGRDPQPGLALLRLGHGSAEAAAAAVRSSLAATADRPIRARLLAAAVEIRLALDDVEGAAAAAEELQHIAHDYAGAELIAAAAQATGAVAYARRDLGTAVARLREACRRWQELDDPYDCARARQWLARAYEGSGDAESAGRERDAAAAALARLGPTRPQRPGGLTEREVQVLGCVARGQSNRDIAGTLVISEKTVARHLSNIFVKIGVTSRTEAAAYVFQHQLVGQMTHDRPGVDTHTDR